MCHHPVSIYKNCAPESHQDRELVFFFLHIPQSGAQVATDYSNKNHLHPHWIKSHFSNASFCCLFSSLPGIYYEYSGWFRHHLLTLSPYRKLFGHFVGLQYVKRPSYSAQLMHHLEWHFFVYFLSQTTADWPNLGPVCGFLGYADFTS